MLGNQLLLRVGWVKSVFICLKHIYIGKNFVKYKFLPNKPLASQPHFVMIGFYAESYKEIAFILNRTESSVSSKAKKLGLTSSLEWTESEINKSIILLNEGKSFKYIGNLIGKSQDAVTRKMHRLGYKSGFKPNRNKGKTKYANYDWDSIQEGHDKGLSYEELLKIFKLSSHSIIWAKNNNKLKIRSRVEGIKLAYKKGKYKPSSKEGIERYRQLCEFKFGVKSFPKEFNLKLIQEHGWYQAANRGNNLDGVSRDHIISVKFGFENNIDPEIISHPANCRLMRHTSNQKKNRNSNMSLEELKGKIKRWNKKHS
jgi:hypothetical protein